MGNRYNLTWGGFGIVDATLEAMSIAIYDLGWEFDNIINISGSTYPLVSGLEIRKTLSRYAEKELMATSPIPTIPDPYAWHYFVECDGRLHRIGRLLPPKNVQLYFGSQWFIITKSFGKYLLEDQDFVLPYIKYAKHIIVADENFFATVLKHSPFCHKHVNENFLFVDFWGWEEGGGGGTHRCLQPDPKHCGRSPRELNITIVKDLMSLNEKEGEVKFLFARKLPEGEQERNEILRILVRSGSSMREEL